MAITILKILTQWHVFLMVNQYNGETSQALDPPLEAFLGVPLHGALCEVGQCCQGEGTSYWYEVVELLGSRTRSNQRLSPV